MRIGNGFFKENRRAFKDRLPEGTAVFMFAGEAPAVSADNDARFLPDRNFYYLTGLQDPCARLIITKTEEYLFALKRDPLKERWTGKRHSKEELESITGISKENIFDLGDFDDRKYELLKEQKLTPAGDSGSIMKEAREFFRETDAEDVKDILISMRMVKREEEIESIREACRMTEDSIEDMVKVIKEGTTEVELYAAMEYAMMRRGSLIPAFTSITAIGENVFFLHHEDPEGEEGPTVKEGSQIQLDVGARCNGYCADISRAIFIGKKQENDRRYELLELIDELRQTAWKTIRPGITMGDLNKEMRRICGVWLCAHNVLHEGYTDEDVKKYYWHNTGHHLGLDVHDVSLKDKPFEKGNCLAIEPGVYIEEWGTGFRIEDDVLVTDNGCELLSSGKNVGEVLL
ncbi:MAG: aminopeptidase P family protein [Clostridiales bacterium]|nr:aminopeptidase P family protein [Clostridiales bacterium]